MAELLIIPGRKKSPAESDLRAKVAARAIPSSPATANRIRSSSDKTPDCDHHRRTDPYQCCDRHPPQGVGHDEQQWGHHPVGDCYPADTRSLSSARISAVDMMYDGRNRREGVQEPTSASGMIAELGWTRSPVSSSRTLEDGERSENNVQGGSEVSEDDQTQPPYDHH